MQGNDVDSVDRILETIKSKQKKKPSSRLRLPTQCKKKLGRGKGDYSQSVLRLTMLYKMVNEWMEDKSPISIRTTITFRLRFDTLQRLRGWAEPWEALANPRAGSMEARQSYAQKWFCLKVDNAFG